MDVENDSKVICSALDQFCIPAALVDQAANCFLAYNQSFLDAVDPEGRLLNTKLPNDLITLLGADATEDINAAVRPSRSQACRVETIDPGKVRTGQCFRRDDNQILLLLDTPDEEDGQKEHATGKLIGRQMEKARVRRLFHDAISPEILGAAFAAEALTCRLDATGNTQATEVKALSQYLSELIASLHSAINEDDASTKR